MKHAVKNKRWVTLMLILLLYIFFVMLGYTSTGKLTFTPVQWVGIGIVVLISVGCLYFSETIKRAGEQWVADGFEPDTLPVPSPVTALDDPRRVITIKLEGEALEAYKNAASMAALEALLDEVLADYYGANIYNTEELRAILDKLDARVQAYEEVKERTK